MSYRRGEGAWGVLDIFRECTSSKPYLGQHGSGLDTDRRRSEQLGLWIRPAIRTDSHPVHGRETRHGGQVICRSTEVSIVEEKGEHASSSSTVWGFHRGWQAMSWPGSARLVRVHGGVEGLSTLTDRATIDGIGNIRRQCRR